MRVTSLPLPAGEGGKGGGAAMRDRTRELRQDSWDGDEDEDEDEEEGGDEAEGRARVSLMGLSPPATPSTDTLKQAGGVRGSLRLLQQKLERLEGLQEELLGTPLPPPGLKQELTKLQDEIQALIRDTRSRLRGLEPGQEEARGSFGARVRRNQHGVLSQQLLVLTGRCHWAQSQFRQRSLERLRRQLHIAGSPSVTEEELEQMLESGQSEIFVANVLAGPRVTRAALEEVESRHQELQKLERGLRELGEIFALLGGTLEEQGEVVDRIERNILDSGTTLRKGQQHLEAAQRSQRGTRQKKLLVAGCILGAFVLLLIVLGVTLGRG